MNKENKSLNIALRICIIVTWIMSNVSFVMLASGMKNINVEGLNNDNFADRVLEVLGDIGSNTVFYYVTLGMVGACLLLAILTRYKASMVSFIAKIIFLGYTIFTMISGLSYVGALGSCGGLADLKVSGTSAEAVQTALTSAGFSGDAAKVAETLTNKDELGYALAGYFLPIFILFILFITSLHCLIKKSDPNSKGANQGGQEGQYIG